MCKFSSLKNFKKVENWVKNIFFDGRSNFFYYGKNPEQIFWKRGDSWSIYLQGSMDHEIGPYFKIGMQWSMDRQIGPFLIGMQRSMDRQIRLYL